jgi:hypothetical protein
MIRAIYQQLYMLRMILTSPKPQICTLEEAHTNIADLLVKFKANLDYRANLYSVCAFSRAKLLGVIKALLMLYYGFIRLC